MKSYRVVIEVALEPGKRAEAVVFVDAFGEDGATVAALEAMSYRIRAKSVEVAS